MITLEQRDHGTAFGRALADWIDRGARWAVVPRRLVEWAGDGDELAGWGALPEALLHRCLASEEAGTPAVPLYHLCLLEDDHGGLHGFGVAAVDAQRAAADFAVQMDPVARVARRARAAAHAAGMTLGAVAFVGAS